MAKDVLITPASGLLEVKATNGSTIETKIEDGNIVLTGTLTASGYNDSQWNTGYTHSTVTGGIHNSGTVTSVATGGGLTGGTITSAGTLSHADTSSQASLTALINANVVSDIDLDTYGHITSLATRTLTLANLGYTGVANAQAGTVTSVATGGGLTGGAITTTGTLSHADTSSQASLTALTGANVVSDVDLDTYGHTTSLATRTMTLNDLGYTGATNANYITNNNQLTNGANYITDGNTNWNNSYGFITGNQTITLSGDVTGSGTTAITTTVANDSHTHSNYLVRNSNETTTGYMQAEGFVGSGGNGLRISMPHGASYHTTTPVITGAWKIKLPQSMTSTMMRMTIKIYDYATNESFEVSCGGYNYNSNSSWYNEFAYIVASPKVNKNLQVRFGHDGSYACIWIGETSSTWDYPQVFVTDFQAGYNAFAVDSWNDNWTITAVTSFDTVTDTVTNTQIGRYVDNNVVLHAGNYSSYAVSGVTSVATGGGLTGGTITSTGTLSHADTSSQASLTALTGANVVSDVDLDTYGHVTSLATRTMTLANLGYTGATNANYITNNNQLTNGMGFTTYTANQAVNTSSDVTFNTLQTGSNHSYYGLTSGVGGVDISSGTGFAGGGSVVIANNVSSGWSNIYLNKIDVTSDYTSNINRFIDFTYDGTSKWVISGNSSNDLAIWNRNGAGRYLIIPSSNVGIGTATPNSPLQITATSSATGEAIALMQNTTGTYGWKIGIDTSNDGNLLIRNRFNGTDTTRLEITDAGNVGIGTTTPWQRLDVHAPRFNSASVQAYTTDVTVSPPAVGELHVHTTDAYTTQRGGRITLGGKIGTSALYESVFGAIEGFKSNALNANAGGGLYLKTTLNWTGALTTRMTILEVGDVGIGTESPINGKLHIYDDNNGTAGSIIYLQNDPGETSGTYTGIRFGSWGSKGGIFYKVGSYGGYGRGDIIFSQQSSADATVVSPSHEVMRIQNDGDVGIGTVGPSTKLDVEYSTVQDSVDGIKSKNTLGTGAIWAQGYNDESNQGFGVNRAGAIVSLTNFDTTVNNYSVVGFFNSNNYQIAGVHGVTSIHGTTGTTEGHLEFWTRNAGSNYHQSMTIDEDGNVGVLGTVAWSGGSSTNSNTAYGWGNHSTQSYATQSYVGTQIANLVDSAPGTLDTLNELALALGDDPNFATTVTNSIATKLPLAGGTMTGDLIIDKADATFSLGDRASNDATGRTILLEGTAESNYGEGSGRIFFSENNYTGGANADNYGFSIYYEGHDDVELPSGFQPNQGNGTWAFRRHNGNVNGIAIMSGTRLNNNVDFSGVLTWSGGGSANANTAYGWGNHASAGYTTGNQTITLSGDVTGSGTTSITTTVANDSHTHSTYLPLSGGTMTGALHLIAGASGTPSVTFGDTDTGFYGTSNVVYVALNGNKYADWTTGGLYLRQSANKLINQRGTESLPSLTYDGDLDTGIWQPDAGIIAVSTNGSEVLRIDSSGNVGIGTESPDQTLHVKGDLDGTTGVLEHTGTGTAMIAKHSGAGTPVPFEIEEGSSADTNSLAYGVLRLTRSNMTADGAGANLHFQTKRFNGQVQEMAGIGGSIKQGLSADVNPYGELNFYTTYNNTIRQQRMIIDYLGNVGIGTTVPSSWHNGADNLVVGGGSGDTGITIYSGASNISRIHFSDSSSGSAQYQGWIAYNHSADQINMATNGAGSGHLTIASTGFIGIGGTPANDLHLLKSKSGGTNYILNDNLSNTANSNATFLARTAGTSSGDPAFGAWVTGGQMWQFGQDVSDSGKFKFATGTDLHTSTKLTFTTTGYVGIGTDSPGATLDIRGSGGYVQIDSDGSNGYIKSDYNLNLYADSTNDNSDAYQNIKFYTAGSNERMIINHTGDIGIGTPSPVGKLDIVSDGNVSLQAHTVNIAGDGYGSEAQLAIMDSADVASNIGGGINFGGKYNGNTGTEWARIKSYKENATAGQYGGGLKIMTRDHGAGMVDVMTFSPEGVITMNYGSVKIGTAGVSSAHFNTPEMMTFNIDSDNNATNKKFGFYTNALDGGGTELLTILEAGNVGIGTTTPHSGSKLHIETGVDTVGLKVQDTANSKYVNIFPYSSTASNFGLIHAVGGLALAGYSDNVGDVYITQAGLVGIGTVSPQQSLETIGNINVGVNNVDSFLHGGASLALQADSNVLITADSNDTSGVADAGDIIMGAGSAVNTDGSRDSNFATIYPSGVPRNEWMRITSPGYVGIGTPSPREKLDVVGNVIFAHDATNPAGYIASTDVSIFGSHQSTGTVFEIFNSADTSILKILGSGTSTFSGALTWSGGGSANANTAYGWGNHASAGYTTYSANQALDTTSSPTFQYLTLTGQLVGGLGAVTTGGTTDWNHSTNARSGMGYTLLLGQATNGPNFNNNYYHAVSFEYGGWQGTGNMTQLGIPYTGHTLAYRSRYSGTWGAWYKIFDSGNFNDLSGNWNASYSWGNHASAGYQSFNQTLDTTSSPTFVDLTLSGQDIQIGLQGGLHLGDDSRVMSVGYNSGIWGQNDRNSLGGLSVNYRGYNEGYTQFRDFGVYNGKSSAIALFDGTTSKVGIGTSIPDTLLHLTNVTDVDLSTGGGTLQIGLTNSYNMVLDDNEIQGRNNGSSSPLYINTEGSDVHVNSQVVLHAGNYSTYANMYVFPHTISQSAVANSVVQRQANGYILGNYINMTDDSDPNAGNAVTEIITKKNDDYYRGSSASKVRTFLNVEDGATAGGGTITLTGDVSGSGSGSITTTVADDSHSHSNYVSTGGGTITSGYGNTTLRIETDNIGRALVVAGKSAGGQGTGAFEVTQDGTYGGGMSYNGDGTPAFVTGETADWTTFYAMNSGNRTEVFGYAYNSTGDVTFNGILTWASGNSTQSNTAYAHSQTAHAPSNANYITNNNQLTNGAGYITDGNTNWDNSYGFITTNISSPITVHGGSSAWAGTSTISYHETIGTGTGSIHLDPDSSADSVGSAITFGASDSSSGTNSHAGIYVISDGTYGTKMIFGTTDSYATGSKANVWIDHSGNFYTGATVFTEHHHSSVEWAQTYIWGNHANYGYATQTYVGTQIANLVDSAPGTLNTLNELASALGDDQNFSTTVTNSIATKLPLAGGTMSGTINLGNYSLTHANDISFYDPGPNEGLAWLNTNNTGGQLWKIYESHDDLVTNEGGNLQFVTDTTSRIRFTTSGGIQARGGFAGESDSYTKLLIHSDTFHANTYIQDSSPSKHTISMGGDPVNSTTQSKFSGSSIYFDGNDELTIPSTSDFAFGNVSGTSGDFTIDFWMRPDNTTPYWDSLLNTYMDNVNNGFIISVENNLQRIAFHTGTVGWQYTDTAMSVNTWNHVAVVRGSPSTSYTRIYLNGKRVAQFIDNHTYGAGELIIGGTYGSHDGNFTGYLDEIRISKGIARWGDDFIPPQRPYSTINADSFTEMDKLNTAMTALNNGSIGIGTDTPDANLELRSNNYVGGGYGVKLRFTHTGTWTNSTTGEIIFGNTTNDNLAVIQASTYNNTLTTGKLTFFINGMGRADITSTGLMVQGIYSESAGGTSTQWNTAYTHSQSAHAPSNANYITNNNQLTNGAGYTTYTANQALDTTSNPTFNNITLNGAIQKQYTSQWAQFYSQDVNYWYLKSDRGMQIYDIDGNRQGWIYHNSAGSFGLLDPAGNWRVVVSSGAVDLRGTVTKDGDTILHAGNYSSYAVSGVTSVATGGGLTGGTITSTGTLSHADTSSQASLTALTGANVVSDVDLDTYGHVTSLATRTMTLANLGYTGATNANYITNNNQLTNGAGYTTYTANQALDTSSTPYFSSQGVNVSAPLNRLHIIGTGTGWNPTMTTGNAVLRLETNFNTPTTRVPGDYGAGIVWNHLSTHSTTHSNNVHAWLGIRVYATPGHETSAMVFATNNTTTPEASHDAGLVERMCINPNGDIGIGTIDPHVLLHLGTVTEADTGTGQGTFQIGPTAGANIVMDDNEIQARNNGSTAQLNINHQGGTINFGGPIYSTQRLDAGSIYQNNNLVLDANNYSTYANLITNNNQLTNGAGYVTTSGWTSSNDGSGSGLDADLLDGQQLTKISHMHSQSDFVDGTLITTDLSATSGYSWVMELDGKSYSGSNPPFKVSAQGYFYLTDLINCSAISYGGSFPSTMKAFYYNGYLAIWFARHGYWHSFDVMIRHANTTTNSATVNRVTGISNSTDISGSHSKVVTITPIISLTSQNYSNYAVTGVTSVATGGGLTGGTITSTGTLSHADTSSQSSLTALTGANVVSDVDLDTYGHVTNMATRTMTLANLGYTGATNANYITNNNQLTNGAGYITDGNTGWNNSYGYITGLNIGQVTAGTWSYGAGTQHSYLSADTMVTASGDQAGLEIWQDTINADAFMQFHIGGDYALYFGLDGGTNKLSVGGWSMGAVSYAIYHEGNKPSLADLGYTGATNANYITNNNQLTNGAGYTTYTANQALNTTSSPTFADAYTDGWWRNNATNEGMYNQANGNHFYASTSYWEVDSPNGFRFRDAHEGTIVGYVHWAGTAGSNGFGLKSADGDWSIQCTNTATYLYNASYVEGNLILHAGNYNNYANYITNNNQLANGAGYVTSSGVTSVATGGGLTGGTITSTGTLSHADTSSVSNVDNSGNNFIQDISFDTYGHVTSVTSAEASGGGGGGASVAQSIAMAMVFG